MFRQIVILMAIALFSQSLVAATMYRWTDENGTVHYTETPPRGAEYTEVEVSASSPLLANAPTQDANPEAAPVSEPELSPAERSRRERAQRREEAQALEAELAAGCENARYNLAQLEPRPKVLISDGEGGTRVMDDQERLDNIDEARTYIEENCQ